MHLETQHLRLRDWHPIQDARYAIDIFGDERVMVWMDGGKTDSSLRQSQGRIQRYRDRTKQPENNTWSWAIEQKNIGRVIGHIILTPLPDLTSVFTHPVEIIDPEGMPTDYIEMGWHFRPASWGFGYATEAALCIAQYAFDTLNLPVLLAVTDPKNKRSVAMMARLGMRYDGVTTRYYGGEDLLLYKLSRIDLAIAQKQWVERQATHHIR